MRNPLTPAESPSPELLGRTCNLLLCLAVTARIERQRDGRREECRDAAGIDAERTRGWVYGGKRDRAAHAVTLEYDYSEILRAFEALEMRSYIVGRFAFNDSRKRSALLKVGKCT